jgi:hypothetical protein
MRMPLGFFVFIYLYHSMANGDYNIAKNTEVVLPPFRIELASDK